MENRNRFRNLISANVGERQLENEVSLAVRQNGAVRMLAKILFCGGTADFYVALPYLKVSKCGCGVRDFSANQNTTISVNENVNSWRMPVKLSYHESGQVHLKGQGVANAPLLARVDTTPIARLRGEHVFTLELEGIDHFASAKPRHLQRASMIAIELPQPTWRAQVVAYAGQSADEVSIGKYGAANEPRARPTFVIRFVRPTLTRPLYLGLFLFTGQTLNTEPNPTPCEIALSGFVRNENAATALFLHGS